MEREYKRIKLLGEGSYGKAFLVNRIADNQLCVIKQIDMSHMTDQEKTESIKEANILQMLKHHNIIKYHEQFKTKKGRLCIVMDYAENGDLSAQIKIQQPIQEEQILDWLTQICCALNYVHSKNIIHRDIKAQNIFLAKNKMIKLADFGIARILSSTKDKAKTFIGTPYYLAPELVESKPYTTKADIWSLGVLTYELCALKPPFEANNMHALILKIIKGVYPSIPSQYSKELKQLIQEMMTIDPNKRLSAQQILQKSIIKKRSINFLSETRALIVEIGKQEQKLPELIIGKQQNNMIYQEQINKEIKDKLKKQKHENVKIINNIEKKILRIQSPVQRQVMQNNIIDKELNLANNKNQDYYNQHQNQNIDKNKAINNIQLNRVGSPNTRLPQLNFQPPLPLANKEPIKKYSNDIKLNNDAQKQFEGNIKHNVEKIQKQRSESPIQQNKINPQEAKMYQIRQRPPSECGKIINHNQLQKKIKEPDNIKNKFNSQQNNYIIKNQQEDNTASKNEENIKATDNLNASKTITSQYEFTQDIVTKRKSIHQNLSQNNLDIPKKQDKGQHSGIIKQIDNRKNVNNILIPQYTQSQEMFNKKKTIEIQTSQSISQTNLDIIQTIQTQIQQNSNNDLVEINGTQNSLFEKTNKIKLVQKEEICSENNLLKKEKIKNEVSKCNSDNDQKQKRKIIYKLPFNEVNIEFKSSNDNSGIFAIYNVQLNKIFPIFLKNIRILFPLNIINYENTTLTHGNHYIFVKLILFYKKNLKNNVDNSTDQKYSVQQNVNTYRNNEDVDVEKMLIELNEMVSGNYQSELFDFNFEKNLLNLENKLDKDDYLDEDEENNLSLSNSEVCQTSNNLENNHSAAIKQAQNNNAHGESNSTQNNQEIPSSNQNGQIESKKRIQELRKYLEKEIGTMHFSKAYKLALCAFEKSQDTNENSEFFKQFKIMFPALNLKEIMKYSTLFHSLVMIEKAKVPQKSNI